MEKYRYMKTQWTQNNSLQKKLEIKFAESYAEFDDLETY